jgi:hypothetical protein
MKYYHLFLDDIRKPVDAWLYTRDDVFLKEQWVIVRSHAAFTEEVTKRFAAGEWPVRVAFDHDLADVHYLHLEGEISYERLEEKTGYHSAKWLIDFCLNHDLRLPAFSCHSMNPVGKENILSLLAAFAKMQAEKE